MMPRPHPLAHMLQVGVLFSLCWFASVAGASAAEISAYGPDGALFRLTAGPYSSLFPEGSEREPDQFVIRLDRVAAGESQAWLVPSTGASDDEEPLLVVDQASGNVFVFWSEKETQVENPLHVARFSNGEWSDPSEISGDPVPDKSSLRIALARDQITSDEESVPRTVVHLLWNEAGDPLQGTFYSPLILVDGELLQWNPVLDLDQFDSAATVGDSKLSASLFSAITLAAAGDSSSVVAVVPNRRTGRLLVLKLRMLPRALQTVADGVRGHIVGLGQRSTSGSILTLADDVRTRIVETASQLHEGVIEYVAEQTYLQVLENGATYDDNSLPLIADQVWNRIIDSGASLTGDHLGERDGPCSILQIGNEPLAAPEHQIEICPLSDRPAPETGDGPHRIFVSEDGQEVLVAWKEGNGVRYRRSEGDGWSEVFTAQLDETVTVDRAFELLERSVRTSL